MALYPHDHERETVVHDGTTASDSTATALVVIIALAVAGFLIWLFAFSSVFHHSGGSNPSPTAPNVQVDNNQNTAPDSGTNTNPQPATSP